MKTKSQNIKLLKKVSRKQFQFGLIIVFLCLMVLFLLTRFYIKKEAEESLYSTTYRIEKQLKNNQNITSLKPLYEILVVKELKPQILKDTLIYDEQQQEEEIFRELNSYIAINGTNYQIVTRTLFADFDDTLFSILISFTILIILVYLAQYYYNKKLNKTIWQPFFNNLEIIKAFSIQSNQTIVLEASDVLEFSELNQHIQLLTEKVTSDYQNLKQFTEDLSHEIQTPLSIIQAKIENLVDDSKNLNEAQIMALHDIQKNSKRLSKLNQGLILLVKIENQQFNNPETINANAIIKQLVEDFEDISTIKNLKIELQEDAIFKFVMDKVLADILFSNLISNAIKYAPENGRVSILVNSDSFTIGNSGTHQLINTKQLFDRFYKEDKNSRSLGLGLAIVKKICDFYNLTITYIFKVDMHFFSLTIK